MTRKRYIKLLMAHGLSRNRVEKHAKTIGKYGLSYQLTYEMAEAAIEIAEKTVANAVNMANVMQQYRKGE